MLGCVKIGARKYSVRNSPPYSANKCKSMKKKGNDGNHYISQPDKNGVYRWVIFNKTLKNKTTKETSKATLQDLQMLAKKYLVSPSGSSNAIANTLVELRGASIKIKKHRQIIEQFLKKSTPSTKRWGFVPAK
jgi:hypothetical protein